MEKIVMNATEVLILIGLLFGSLKYWKWKLLVKFDIQQSNIAFGIFLSGQILAISLILFSSMDPQNGAYLESLSWFGNGSMNFWNIIGIQIFGILVIYLFANIIGHLIIKGLLNSNSIQEEIRNENISIALLTALSVIVIGFTTSSFVLRPFIFNWIAEKATLVPMY
jgi:hypothetical protein